MPQIDDIRVNGQQATTVTPIVAGLHPVVGWDFEENVAAPSQASFDIKIGTSSVDHGTDEFLGTIVDQSQTSSSNFYEHESHNLIRGTTYFGQVKATDPDADQTPWVTFSFAINNLPFVTGFSLTPSTPTISNDIEISYTYNDTDNHNEAGTKIRWLKNNLLVSEFDDLCILPSRATKGGESWSAKIVPSDGLEFGSTVETASVTIQDVQSSFKSLVILPTDANVDDILKADFELNDSEYAAVDGIVSFEWFINGTAVANSDKQIVRLDLIPGDAVKVTLKLKNDEGVVIAESSSDSKTILDVRWYLFNLRINGLDDASNINDLTPILEWNVSKSTSVGDVPDFIQVTITKTPSLSGPISDTGVVQYNKSSFVIPKDTLSRGQDYYVHIAVSDSSTIVASDYVTKRLSISGSSWSENVSNTLGWTIETKLRLTDTTSTAGPTVAPTDVSNLGIYIHDGTKFCVITFSLRSITFLSDTSLVFDFPTNISSLKLAKTFKISGKGNDVKILMNNKLVVDAVGIFTNTSNLKFIEYGDVDTKNTNSGLINFFRYTTDGAFSFGDSLPDENTFHFHSIGKIEGGEIKDIHNDIIAWLPNDAKESTKLISFNENSTEVQLPTVTKNFSPITSIFVDKNRNKYIGTANGVNAIYGEKHTPDFEFLTSDTDVVISSDKFDRITTVPTEKMSLVEPDSKIGWFTIDTTFRSIGSTSSTEKFETGDPYDPYKFGIESNAIHYYSQRTHGHDWFDKVDNSKGWQVLFSFQLNNLEQDDFKEKIDHEGFGIFINDGERQEILFFYEDRIRLFYANVFVPIVTTVARNYRIVGKGDDLLIYQKLDNPSITSYQLIVNGSGLFTTSATITGNSRKPKLIFDNLGVYHAVWHDDGSGSSQIFYSSFDGNSWSNPEIVNKSKFSLRNPDLAIDGQGRVWVTYEDTSWGQSEITVSVRDDSGWNPPTRITNYRSTKSNPSIIIDIVENVHLVWEDDRNGPIQIMWAERDSIAQAWKSSGQFGEDTVVMQQNDTNDPYTSGAIFFKNPQLAFISPKVWLVAEGHNESDHTSVIFRGFRDIEDKTWTSIGVPAFDDAGNFITVEQSSLSSPVNRNCVNPTIGANPSSEILVIAWEDETEPISQIWASVYNNKSTETVAPTQLTSRAFDARTPSAGFISNQCAILFESQNQIYVANYDSNVLAFSGSAIAGSSDVLLAIDSTKTLTNPAIPQYVPSKGFKMIYDFLNVQDGTVQTVEFPDFYLIGDATVDHAEASYPTDQINTSLSSESVVSNVDSREFAFGDLSENIGMLAHWKDISMYFGYDAKPPVIGKFNSTTVLDWPDDRINDIFVDTFGNIIAATFGGLVYHNVFTGKVTNIDGRDKESTNDCGDDVECLLKDQLITAVKWGGNGAWFVGTATGLFLSTSAGKIWSKFSSSADFVVNSIDIDSKGNAVCGTSDGVKIAKSSDVTSLETISITDGLPQDVTSDSIRSIAVDENDVIWAGTNSGLIRIENKNNFMFFNRKSGMRASHVTDISIVNKNLRYVATANGVDKMNGTTFSSISTQTHDIQNNNISQVLWVPETDSLWVAGLHNVYEIVFRDPAHEIIQDEVVRYDQTELLTEESFDASRYTVLDLSEVQVQSGTELKITPESTTVHINNNKLDFGFTLGDSGQSISFVCNLLIDDEVTLRISNKFLQNHDFNQTEIEKKVLGEKRTVINKLENTIEKGQSLLLSGGDKNQIILDAGQSSFPFTTVLLDRVPPTGALRKIDTLTPTSLKFKILAFDDQSGIDGYILSNFENFTSDGDSPLEFSTLPVGGVVTHDIGAGLNNVSTSLTFPLTTKLLTGDTVTVGPGGSALDRFTDVANNKVFLYAATDSPPIIWRFDPTKEEWESVARLVNEVGRTVTKMLEFNNVLFVATANASASGVIYRTTDGLLFDPIVTSDSSSDFTAIAASPDGIIYFGDGNGDIYEYKNNVGTKKFTGIGDEIHSMDVFEKLLIVGTGNGGRIYTIDLDNDSNLIVFSGNDTDISEVHVFSTLTSTQTGQTNVYAGSGDFTTIYRGDIDTFDFIKSFTSFAKTIGRIKTLDRAVLEENPNSDLDPSQVVAVVGDSLFKHNKPSWEFFFKHNEDINDFFQYDDGISEGIYVISETKIAKWTNTLSQKTVYLRLRDKAGNISTAPDTSTQCPPTGTDADCFNFAYSINIADLKNFINQSRIVDIDEYGTVIFTHDSPNDRQFYSADEIDEEIGIYLSEVLNGSNDLVSWKTITWSATTPSGTSVDLQIRHGVTEAATLVAEWSADLIKGTDELVNITHITDQYFQFRAILKSQTRDVSPSLTSVVLRNLTTQASHFFTTNFVVPSRPIKGLLTSNTFIPVSADIVFGINLQNSTDFGDYQIIEPNRLFTTAQGQFGDNFRIGARLLSPATPQISATVSLPGDPYDEGSFDCTIEFDYTNSTAYTDSFHFRVKFFNDILRTQLIHTFFSGNDQTGWSHGSGDNTFPGAGISVTSGTTATIQFEPLDKVSSTQKWFITIEAWDGSFFETIDDNNSFICAACNVTNEANLLAKYYKTGVDTGLTSIPAVAGLTPDHTVLENNIDFSLTSADWITSKGVTLTGFDNDWTVRYTGKIQAPVAGTYTFELQSNDGSRLFINTIEVIDHDGTQAFTTKTGTITLTEGFHDIEVHFYDGSGAAGLQLRWKVPPGLTDAVVVPSSRLFRAVSNEYCDDATSPKIFNFAVQLELENGESVKFNLTP